MLKKTLSAFHGGTSLALEAPLPYLDRSKPPECKEDAFLCFSVGF